jgi:molybdate transport system substrate-binding protein
MKKTLALLLALLMVFSLFACGTKTDDAADADASTADETENTVDTADETGNDTDDATAEEPVELIVFAAASMTETLNQIIEMYKEVAPNVTITPSYESSGTLKTQIEEGADCDIFISAGQKQMNQLDITADPEVNTDGLDFVLEGSRINLLENKVTLVVPEANEKGIKSFSDMAEGLKNGTILLAMGNSDVPVGQYTQKILTYFELNEEDLASAGCITYGSNVKEVTTQVSEATVDCGVIYCTDAFSAGLTIVDYATAEMCGQVIYPAAVMRNSANAEAAQAFLEYLQSDAAMAVFEAVGFAPAE